MDRKDEIKVYNEKEETEKDYENFRKDWQYNRDTESGVHKSGLKVAKRFTYAWKFVYDNLYEWMDQLKSEGLTREEVCRYLRMVDNQFVILTEKEPMIEKELTLEEKVAEMEEIDKRNVERAKKYNHLSDAEAAKMESDLKNLRDKYYKNGGRW